MMPTDICSKLVIMRPMSENSSETMQTSTIHELQAVQRKLCCKRLRNRPSWSPNLPIPFFNLNGSERFPSPWRGSVTVKCVALEHGLLLCPHHILSMCKMCHIITYGPHKAVAEVSNHNEPIGRNSGIQLVRKIRKSMGFTFSCFVLN